MSITRHACVLVLLVAFVSAIRAEDARVPAKPVTPTKTASSNGSPKDSQSPATTATKSADATAKKPPATTAEPAAVPEADGELLEFLGSVDSGDEDFLDYLSQAEIDKSANNEKVSKDQK